MGNYAVIIESVMKKHRDEVNRLYPKAFYAEEINSRKQYASSNRDIMDLEIKKLMIDNNIDVEDFKIRQDVINALNLFYQYCLHYRSTQ